MDALRAHLPEIAVAAALAWGSGLRLYAVHSFIRIPAGGRAVINTSPEPFTNWSVSLLEDGLVPAGLWLAIAHPLAFLALLGAFAIATVLLLRQIALGLGLLLARLRGR